MNESEIHDRLASMRALVQRSARGPHDMVLTEVPRPAAGPDEYLVRVGAAGVNFADAMQTRGIYRGGPRAPYVAGFEVAGEIIGLGSQVADPLPIGSRVIGTGRGAFAEYAAVTATGSVIVPDGWSDAESLGMILNWATAVAALRPIGDLRAGETVLIHAAAGGVGQAAVRLARHYGARVIAVAGQAKHDLLRELGVDEIIDARHPELAASILRRAGRPDLVLDSVGKHTLGVSMAVAQPFSGRVVVFGSSSGPASVSTQDLIFDRFAQLRSLHIGAFAAAAPAAYRAVLDELEDLIARGVYPPGRPQMHPLHEGPAVLEQLEDGRTAGKHGLDPWL